MLVLSRLRSQLPISRSLVARISQSAVPPWALYEETISRYEPGGYRPTSKGDLLNNGRYEILKKLGWGQYSTVWLAEDNHDTEGACVALKILDDKASQSPLIHELETLKLLQERNPNHPGFAHVPTLHDAFTSEISVHALKEVQHRFPESIAKVMIRHLLLALDYCHTECGIIHTDVKSTNVMTTFGCDLKASDEVLTFQDPDPFHATAPDSSEVKIFATSSIASLPESVNDVEIWNAITFKLIDFGVACPKNKTKDHFTQLVYPVQLRAPEVALGAGWGCPVDIWAAGCMLFQLYTLHSIIPNDITDPLLPLFQWRLFGDFPADLVGQSSMGMLYFDEHAVGIWLWVSGHLLDEMLQQLKAGSRFGQLRVSLEEYMHAATNGEVGLSDNGWDFLHRMLEVDPSKRATAKQLLEHPWLMS